MQIFLQKNSVIYGKSIQRFVDISFRKLRNELLGQGNCLSHGEVEPLSLRSAVIMRPFSKQHQG